MPPKQAKNKGGRPRLSAEEKARRGTLRPVRERALGAPPKKKTKAATRVEYLPAMTAYIQDVLSGRIVASAWVKLACERHVRDLTRSKADPAWPYVWDADHAIAACVFVEQCPHVEGSWATPTIRLEPWQVFIVASLFGWRHRADLTRRRFTTFYLEVARKAAKSTLMAALAFYHLLKEHEPGASVICGATTGNQARVVFGIMQKMGRRSAWLRDQGVTVYANAITAEMGDARPVNSKASTLDGLNPSCIVLDESHAQTFELHDVLKSAQGARRNPLLLCPTTAGYDLLSVGYALRTQLTKVLQQVFENDHLLGVIYAIDDGDDWRDARVWQKSNPMLGVTPTLDWVERYAKDAQQAPGLEGEFRVKVCNEWGNAGRSWLSMTAWDRCADPTIALEQFKGMKCWIGADLAQLDDLASVALVFEKGGLLYGFVKSYLPAEVVALRARAVPAYQEWVNGKLLEVTDGSMIDYATIERDIRALCAIFAVQQIVFDQFGSLNICGNLSNDGLPAIIEAKNAKTFTGPARELEARVMHGRFKHDGNSHLKWAASNAVVTRRIDDSLLPKKESPESPNKIDPIDALLQGIGAWLRGATTDSGTSVYESRGLSTV